MISLYIMFSKTLWYFLRVNSFISIYICIHYVYVHIYMSLSVSLHEFLTILVQKREKFLNYDKI